jgi:hypothetical protein
MSQSFKQQQQQASYQKDVAEATAAATSTSLTNEGNAAYENFPNATELAPVVVDSQINGVFQMIKERTLKGGNYILVPNDAVTQKLKDILQEKKFTIYETKNVLLIEW